MQRPLAGARLISKHKQQENRKMELTHPKADWVVEYTDGRAVGPRKIESQGSTLVSFVHCRIDGVNDDELNTKKARHFHKGGCAVFEGDGEFPTASSTIRLRQIQHLAANTIRATYDFNWPKATPLKSGLEVGSMVLAGAWKRYFTIDSETTQADWKEIPETLSSPLVLTPLPTAIILEDGKGRRLEVGLGDDLWRWNKGLNGEFLHATGRIEITRSGNRMTLRRYVAFCDAAAEAKAAAALAKDPRFQPGEDGAPAPAIPVSQPEARSYRFTSYIAWSTPELSQATANLDDAKELSFAGPDGLNPEDLKNLGDTPKLALDLSTMPLDDASRHNGKKGSLPCWQSRKTQTFFRRVIRQIAGQAQDGTLILKNLTPGFCDVPSHETRRSNAAHWDLPTILDTLIWTRQILGDGWTILTPQSGLWKELPSLDALGAESGFRIGAEI